MIYQIDFESTISTISFCFTYVEISDVLFATSPPFSPVLSLPPPQEAQMRQPIGIRN
jgi:hypothetical protein